MPEQIKATVIGFARQNCPKCHGRGRAGWDSAYRGENPRIHIIPCPCVEYYDLETVQKSWEEARQQAQQAHEAHSHEQDHDHHISNSKIQDVTYNCGIRATVGPGMIPVCPEHGEQCGISSSSTSPNLESQETQSSSSLPLGS